MPSGSKDLNGTLLVLVVALSPIGVFIFFALWQSYLWGFDNEDALFWQWVVDKIIYLGGIVFVGWWAQHLLNKKAKGRENRERRIERIEFTIERLTSIGESVAGILSLSYREAVKSNTLIANKCGVLFTYNRLYGFNIEKLLSNLQSSIQAIFDEAELDFEHRQSSLPKDHSYSMKFKDFSELESFETFSYNLESLLNECTRIHNVIESKH